MKFVKNFKKFAAVLLSLAIIMVSIPMVAVSAQDSTEFDENNIALRMGIVSDLHLAYANYSVDQIKSRISTYANSVATLNSMANNQLDAILLCGDYTSGGNTTQSTTFASASKAILDAINAGKADADKTKFFMTYGNHDTEWSGNISYSDWETILNNYGLLDDVQYGPTNSGSYSGTITKGGKTYYIFSVETATYNNPSNTFRTDVLEWLDNGLAAATTANPNSYVYVISHAPIKESGVYGSDMQFCKNSDWATAEAGYASTTTEGDVTYNTSSDIDGVLSKYPQVMYFSGHTHYSNYLESTIMSDDYTAVNVSSIHNGELISSVSNYLDANVGPKPGYALYLEVDANGNQRIERVVEQYNNSTTTITYSEELSEENPAYNESGTVYGVVVDSVTIDSSSADVTKLAPWVMSAPTSDKAHLVKYSAAARRKTPVFADDAAVTLSNVFASDTDFVADVAFDAATSDTNIIRYEISILDTDGNVRGTRWALGDWTGHAYGVAEGTSHLDATAFKYDSVYLSTGSIGSLIGYKVRVTAVDEFGGTSYIESAAIAEEPDRLLENKHRDYYDNMFTVTPDRAVASSNQSGVTFSTDDNGNLVTVIDSSEGYRNAVFMTSESKYNEYVTNTETKAPFNQWAYPGTNPGKLTDFDAEDTFVYEADFQSTLGEGQFFFHLRTPDLKFDVDSETAVAPWRSDYTGIMINNNAVYLGMLGEYIHLSSAFRMDDTDTHHIKVISSPKLISVYIDGITICESQPFNTQVFGDVLVAGYPIKDRVLSDKMIPTMALHVGAGRVLTVTNQKLYNYYIADENVNYTAPDYLVEDDMFEGITADRVFALSQNDYVKTNIDENGKLSVDVDFTTLTKDQWTNVCYITSKKNFDTLGGTSYFKKDWGLPGSEKGKYFTDLTANDTFIYEADFSTYEIVGGNDLYFHVRTPDTNTNIAAYLTDYTGVHITTGGIDLKMCQKTLASSNAFKFDDDDTHHIVIVSAPTTISVTIDGVVIFDKVPFNKDIAVEKGLAEDSFNSDKMYPTMAQFFMHGAFEISNQTLRKYPAVTSYDSTSQNLINSENGELYCTFAGTKKDTYILDGNNFYCDMRYTSDSAANHKWTQARAYFFGDLNVKNTIDTKKSYVMSALATATNASLKEEETGNTYPSRMTAYIGKYNNEEAFAFIENRTWNLYIGSKKIAGINLANEYGYEIGDTVRITVLLNPFGFSYYFDGELLYSHTYENSALIDYQPVSFGVGGTFGIWRDVVFYENTANGQLYADAISAKADKVNTVKGVYFTDADRQTASTVKAAIDAYTDSENTGLQQYVGVIDNIVSSAKVVNNMVREGLTAVSEDSAYSFGTATFQHYGIALFGAGECPITTEDKWQVDLDLKITAKGASNVRFIFTPYGAANNFNSINGGIMIQDSGSHGLSNEGGIKYNGLGSIGASIANVGTELHLTYKVTPLEDGTLNTQMIVTSIDGATVYSEKNFAVAGITELDPYFYYRTCDLEISNLCVAYDLTDNIATLQTAYDNESGKDTTDIALVCVNNYNKAIADGEAILSDIAYYTRAEIEAAAANITTAANSFEKYGDVNLDGKTNLRDLVRLKKITVGIEDETIPADMDADGDILATDVVLLRKCIMAK